MSDNPPQATIQAPTSVNDIPSLAPLPLLKGALISISRSNPLAKIPVMFQYNPATLSRNLAPRYYQKRGDRFTGPATQSIDITVQLEASDQPWISPVGILPQLAALEMMVNPASADLETYMTDLKSNKMQAVPPLAPRILFVWGPSRILPVQIKSIGVSEKMFNNSLTPMMADVTLKMEVYPFDQVSDDDYQYLLLYLKELEALRVASLAISGAQIAASPGGLS
ncbi:MAG TPA: hypothetical protein VJ885_11780 [Thermoanaerobaculia bacterium]|nr:hypothetical protein [Thermoanaerobaculia bacterium]